MIYENWVCTPPLVLPIAAPLLQARSPLPWRKRGSNAPVVRIAKAMATPAAPSPVCTLLRSGCATTRNLRRYGRAPAFEDVGLVAVSPLLKRETHQLPVLSPTKSRNVRSAPDCTSDQMGRRGTYYTAASGRSNHTMTSPTHRVGRTANRRTVLHWPLYGRGFIRHLMLNAPV